MRKKFASIPLTPEWSQAIGTPEPHGTWFIYGLPKNGKTTFAMQLANELMNSRRRVLYNSIEEGLSLTIRNAIERAGISGAGCGFTLANMECDELVKYLHRRLSADTIFIDSVQFAELTFQQYKKLKTAFPSKLFIYVSHISGNMPEGQVARRIWRDAAVTFRIEGFRAFPVSRYGGGACIDIDTEQATAYWNKQL